MHKEEVIKILGEPDLFGGEEGSYGIFKTLDHSKFDEIEIKYDEENKVKDIIRTKNQEIQRLW